MIDIIFYALVIGAIAGATYASGYVVERGRLALRGRK
jgi:hypothetical protein